MRRFKVSEKEFYNLPENKVKEFKKDFPQAQEVVEYLVNEKEKYNIPVSLEEKFKKDIPLAKRLIKEEESSILGDIGRGALKALDYSGGIVRTGLAGAGELITGKDLYRPGEMKKALRGEAPTGKEIALRAGVPEELELPPEILSAGTPEMQHMPEETKKALKLKFPLAGAIGLALEIGTDPLTYIGIGAIAKGLKKGTKKVVSGITEVSEDIIDSLRQQPIGEDILKDIAQKGGVWKEGVLGQLYTNLQDAKYVLKKIENKTGAATEQIYHKMNRGTIQQSKELEKYFPILTELSVKLQHSGVTSSRMFDILENINKQGIVRKGFKITPQEEEIGKKFRNLYNEMGEDFLPEVKKLDYYSPHQKRKTQTGKFTEETITSDGKLIDISKQPDLESLATSKAKLFRSDTIKASELDKDIIKLTTRYLLSGSSDKYLRPVFEELAPVMAKLNAAGLDKEAKYVLNWGKNILGLDKVKHVKSLLAEEALTSTGFKNILLKHLPDQDSDKVLKWVAGQVYSNLLGFRPKTAIRNLLQNPLLAGTDVGYKYLLVGLKKGLGKEAKQEVEEALLKPFIRGEGVDISVMGGKGLLAKGMRVKSKFDKVAMKLYNWSDTANRVILYFGSKEKALDAFTKFRKNPKKFNKFLKLDRVDRGEKALLNESLVKGKEEFAKEYGRLLVSKYHFDYTKTGTPQFFRSSVGKIMGQFTKWPINYANILASDLKKGFYGDFMKRIGNSFVVLSLLEHGTGLDLKAFSPDYSLQLGSSPGITLTKEALGTAYGIRTGHVDIEKEIEKLGTAYRWRDPKELGTTTKKAIRVAQPYLPYSGIIRDIRQTLKGSSLMGLKTKKK